MNVTANVHNGRGVLTGKVPDGFYHKKECLGHSKNNQRVL